jgi:hydroxyacid-oxoacid transhydrogenase
MKLETAFSMDTSSIKFGPGVTQEVGWDMEEQGATRVMVITDPNLADSEPVSVALESVQKSGIDTVLFDQTAVEPTDISFKEAIKFAEDGKFNGFVAVGGGSSMDTAKAANLYSTYPADFSSHRRGQTNPGSLKAPCGRSNHRRHG